MTQEQTIHQPLTPLEKLHADKQRIQRQCREQAERVNGNLTYIQENAGSLLMSGFSALLFPSSKSTQVNENVQSTVKAPSGGSTSVLGFADILSIGKSLLPVAWEVAQPLLMSWGMRKAKKWVRGLFSRKKKRVANN